MSITGEKVVIDTNIFITIIGKKSPNRWIFEKIVNGEIELCVSSEILWEYEEVLTQKTSNNVARNIIDFLLISPYVHLTDIYFNWQLIENDYDDNKFIDCTISSGAFCLVTYDQHFNQVKKY
ncbi:MAG: putative toxin-antitoxin system toxin component, PIN family [Bacteroidales bacterium]|nr:putative toxin-antitoxin system toxin component, PIN family [Bacteroidales bacterium]